MLDLPDKAEIVIVGGGIQGLLLAFNLAEAGMRDVVVLDAGYWQGGASGRNGTLVRGGFSSEEWIRFFQYSVEQWKGLSCRLGGNVMYTRRGYAIVAESETTQGVIETAHAAHKTLGVKSERLTRENIRRRLPALNMDRTRDVLFLSEGGTAPHHAAMAAAYSACLRFGVRVFYECPVIGFERAGRRIEGVRCGDHVIRASRTVICAGAQSTALAELAGVELDAEPLRIECMALEPARPIIGPAIALVDRLTYLHQTARGEVVGGAEIPGEKPSEGLESTEYVLPTYARHLVEMFPRLASLRVLRQWGGMIHPAPDGGPLLGPHPDADDLWFSAGWTYGIAGAPGAARLLSKALMSGDIDDRMTPFSVDRFRRGKPVWEASAVIDNASAVTQ